MRNRYLDLQRSKMKKLKEHLNRVRFSKDETNEKNQEEKKQIDIKETPKILYKPGVIVKVTFSEQLEELKKMKVSLENLD